MTSRGTRLLVLLAAAIGAFLVAGAAEPTGGEAAAFEPHPGGGGGDLPAPFPLAAVDPYDYRSAPLEAISRADPVWSPSWEPLNWRVNSDATTELQNEQQVVVSPLDPNNLVAVWRDFRLGYRRVGVGYTLDGGITWHDTLLEEPSYPRHSDPGVTYDRHGGFYAVILSYTGNTSEPNGLFVFKSEDGGVTWGEPVPAVDGVPGVFEDKELIACDRSGGSTDGNLYVTWARFGWETEIMSVRSTDGGASFGSPVRVSDVDGVQWPCPVAGPDGTYYVAWTHFYPPEIRIDRSFDGGLSFGTDITVTSTYTPYTTINGGIAVFSFPAMDCDATGGTFDGRLYIAYMDQGFGDFDIVMRRSDNLGVTWSPPVRVNDDALGNGRDQFHPWTCVSADGVVNVVFYDRRNDPSNFLMDVYLAQSFDGGATFDPNVRVTTVSSDPTAGSLRAGLIGEYIGLAASSATRVHPVWTDTREGNQDVYTSIVDTSFVGVPENPVDGLLQLSSPSPNPFSGATVVGYFAWGAPVIEVSIFDVTGRLVVEMRSVPGPDGIGSIRWDGTDRAGEGVGSGIYFVRATAGEASAVAKAVRLR